MGVRKLHLLPVSRLGIVLAALLLLVCMLLATRATSQVLFDFDSAPIHSSLPVDVTVGGITAHLSATGQGFSIQPANTMGFTPSGFGGLCVYPNSVFAADLVIGFSVAVTDFSIMFAPQELGCDDSALMRATAYLGGAWRGTATARAPQPGTWPTGSLSYNSPLGFDQIVVHYDQRPACTDYGPIFMADNMTVTAALPTSVPMIETAPMASIAPNPFRTAIRLRIEPNTLPVTVTVHDAGGRLVRTLVHDAVVRAVDWNGRDEDGAAVESGVYFCRVVSERNVQATRIVLCR